MHWLPEHPPVSTAPPWVIDVELSLAPTGLYCVRELARVIPIWLAQSHWAIVNDEGFYLRDERLVCRLGQTSDRIGARQTFAQVLQEWRDARDALGFESTPRLFWPGDGRADSVVPKDGDANLVDRIDALAAGLDRLRHRRPFTPPEEPTADLLADCARDTIALAAALAGHRPIVLTILGPEDAHPALVDHLRTAGIVCTKLEDEWLLRPLREGVIPALLASGLAVLLATSRIRLGALIVVAPRALALPTCGEAPEDSQDQLAWNAVAAGAEASLWKDAAAIWWDVP